LLAAAGRLLRVLSLLLSPRPDPLRPAACGAPLTIGVRGGRGGLLKMACWRRAPPAHPCPAQLPPHQAGAGMRCCGGAFYGDHVPRL